MTSVEPQKMCQIRPWRSWGVGTEARIPDFEPWVASSSSFPHFSWGPQGMGHFVVIFDSDSSWTHASLRTSWSIRGTTSELLLNVLTVSRLLSGEPTDGVRVINSILFSWHAFAAFCWPTHWRTVVVINFQFHQPPAGMLIVAAEQFICSTSSLHMCFRKWKQHFKR